VWNSKTIEAYSDFEEAIEPEGVSRFVRAPAEIVAPKCQSGHEGGEDSAGSEGRSAKDQFQLTRPDYLVNESAGSR